MPIRPEQVAEAESIQHEAGQDPSSQVRLVAGPGTGKSSTIEERVRWLLDQGEDPGAIFAVSFTRASSLDLRGRIHGYCLARGHPEGADVAVSTLHSLALRTLRRAGALGAYPADPIVLDDWELRNVFEAEFGVETDERRITRRQDIRRDHEAYWSTGIFDPPNLVPPDPPISAGERAAFDAFHGPRTQLYSCVLPGEIVRQCVERMQAGTLDPVDLLGVTQIIVDEFQDLNPMDLAFVHGLAERGATIFAAGDDDQSLYSFRFASPSGIQEFVDRYPDAGDHDLEACFRCTPAVVTAAETLIQANPMPGRIEKHHISLYEDADPPLAGEVFRWRFRSGNGEGEAIAESCARLIDEGLDPRSILILLSNQRAQGLGLFGALEAAEVPFEPPRAEAFRDTAEGRLVLALLRIVVDPGDYVAHRTLLGIRYRVGASACNEVARAAIERNLNYRQLFYDPLPADVFGSRAESALQAARDVCDRLLAWAEGDTIGDRADEIATLIRDTLVSEDTDVWDEYVGALPDAMTLGELRSYLMLDRDEQQAEFLTDVYRRVDEDVPIDIVFPPKVRVMSMHGAKGLSARVVIIPGLEEQILPGPRRQPYPGLVLEAARMLYVSITRARLACILTYAETRFFNGRNRPQTASRFTSNLGGTFELRGSGLDADVARVLVEQINLL